MAKVSIKARSIVKTELIASKTAVAEERFIVCEISWVKYIVAFQMSTSRSTGKNKNTAAKTPYQPMQVFISFIYPCTERNTSEIAEPTTGTRFPTKYFPALTARLSLPEATRVCSDIIPTNTAKENPNVFVTQLLKAVESILIFSDGLIAFTILIAR